MRIRSLLALGAGGALGAGAMYLFDPDHGERRRREALGQAGRGVRRAALNTAKRSLATGRDVLTAAADGYRGSTTVGRESRPDPPRA